VRRDLFGSLEWRLCMRRTVISLVAFVSIAIALYSQQILPDLSADKAGGTGYLSRWDGRAGELIFYRDITDISAAAVRIIGTDGRTIPIYPLSDLPGATAMTIWDIAETPEGGVIFSAIAEYGSRKVRPVPVKSLLLTYSRDGRLTRLWDVYPYHHHHIAVDASGNVFGLGTKDTKEANYPLLVKYSPDGNVLGEFLPANLFLVGDAVVESGSAYGETQMFVNDEEIFLWCAPTQEILRVSLAGEVRSRNSLDRALQSLAAQGESKRAKIVELFPGPDGQITAQVLLYPKDGSKSKLAMAIFSRDGTAARLPSNTQGYPESARFLGGTQAGKLVFLEETSQPKQLMIKPY
jgi:hypothetical protein